MLSVLLIGQGCPSNQHPSHFFLPYLAFQQDAFHQYIPDHLCPFCIEVRKDAHGQYSEPLHQLRLHVAIADL